MEWVRRQKVVACIRVGQLLHTLHVSKMISRNENLEKKWENHDRNLKHLVTLPTLFSEPKTKINLFLRHEKTIARDFFRRSGSQKNGVIVADLPTSASLRRA